MIIWITGFSGAGKTTIAKKLQENLKSVNKQSILLDGDEVRKALNLTSHYAAEDRRKIAYAYAKLAKVISDQGHCVIVATISMFEEIRKWNRTNNKNYLEIYIKVSEAERKNRDPKKLYTTVAQSMVDTKNRYEEPNSPDLVFNNEKKMTVQHIVNEIYKELKF
jgi:cytidine diphosphoramidate kinase